MPLIILISFIYIIGLRKALLLTFLVTTAIFFYGWHPGLAGYAEILFDAFLSSMNIVLIIAGALLLLNAMKLSGLMKKMEKSLSSISLSRFEKFFFLSMSLTFFFEGIAGFGTPGAVVVPLLVSLGYPELLSLSGVLLMDAIAVIFGAVGTPITGGFIEFSISRIAVATLSAIFNVAAGAVFLFFLFRHFSDHEKGKKFVILSYLVFSISFVLMAYLAYPAASIASSIVLIAFVVYRKARKMPDMRPWLPYAILSLLLIFPHLFPVLKAIKISYRSFSLGLFSPFPLFFITALAVSLIHRVDLAKEFAMAAKKSLSATEVLFLSISIASLMSAGASPMVQQMADVLSGLGMFYPVVSPFIGAIGAFVSGSNTVSNIMFAPPQLFTAKKAGILPELVASLQNSGGGIGNAICLFNIIAAASVIGWKKHDEVIKANILPVVAALLIVGLSGLLLSFL